MDRHSCKTAGAATADRGGCSPRSGHCRGSGLQRGQRKRVRKLNVIPLGFLFCGDASRTVRLPVGLQNLNVHRGVDPAEDLSGLVSAVLVTGMDGAGLPVGPVQGLFRECECERMGQGPLHHRLTAGHGEMLHLDSPVTTEPLVHMMIGRFRSMGSGDVRNWVSLSQHISDATAEPFSEFCLKLSFLHFLFCSKTHRRKNIQHLSVRNS